MKTKFKFILLIAFSGVLFSACEYEYIVPEEIIIPVDSVRFSTDITPIFTEQGCDVSGCHKPNGFMPPDFSPDVVYESILTYVDTLLPAESEIYIKLHDPSSTHVGRSTPEQQALILKWIQEGAHNN